MSHSERICYLVQAMSNHLVWQERLTCWNTEHSFRQTCKWQASLYPFHERFLSDLETRILAISPQWGGWKGMGQEGAKAENQMSRLEGCGYHGRKMAGRPLLPGAIGQHTLPPWSLTPRHPWPKEGTCAFQGSHWWLCCEARRATYVL